MSSSNGNGERADSHNRYQVDNLGLQIGLGLPLQVLGVNMADVRRYRHGGKPRQGFRPKHNSTVAASSQAEIEYTDDGIPIRSLYVTNIDIYTKHGDMYNIFGYFGELLNVYISQSNNGSSKRFGFVTYFSPVDAARVLMMKSVGDLRYNVMYVKAADSWHQPVEGPDGKLIRRRKEVSQAKQEKQKVEEEEDNEVMISIPIEVGTEANGNLNALNDDCIMHILSFLSYKEITRLEIVCKRWQTLSKRLWSYIRELTLSNFLFDMEEISMSVLEQSLMRCGQSLTLLDFSTANHAFTEDTLHIIAKYCPILEILRVVKISLGKRSLTHLGRSCPHLWQFSMKACYSFGDKDIMSLFWQCPKLTHFEIINSNDVNTTFLVNINNKVVSLNVTDCPMMHLKSLIAGLKNISKSLKSLTLVTSSNLVSEDINAILDVVPNLTSLSFRNSMSQFVQLTPFRLSSFIQLTHLDISNNSNVTDKIIRGIVYDCVNLTNLNLSGCGNGSLPGPVTQEGLSVLGKLRKLSVLNISYIKVTNNTSLINITTRNPQFQQLVCRGCPELNDEGSSHVVSMCLKLELFDLSGCNISQKTLLAALTSVKMRTKNIPLKLIVGGTNVEAPFPPEILECSPQLTVVLRNLCEDYTSPDYIDMFFPPSDSDDDDDLNLHSFMFEDSYDSDHDGSWFSELFGDSDSDCDFWLPEFCGHSNSDCIVYVPGFGGDSD